MGRKLSSDGLALSDKVVRALPAPATGNKLHWSGTQAGFGVRVTEAGAKAWVLRYRNRDGRDRTLTIGDTVVWPMAKAAARAKALRQEVDAGSDPLGAKQKQRDDPTIADLAARFEKEHLPRLRPRTAEGYLTLVNNYIRPAIGHTKVAALRFADIETLHRSVAKRRPYAANRCIAVLSKMMSLAVRWEMRQDNPARGIEREPEHKRERFLSPAEIIRLSDALTEHKEKPSANAIRLLLLTGARRNEVLTATWSQFDLVAGVWVKPAATTKQNKLHRVPLNAAALALLHDMKTAAEAESARRVRNRLPPIAHIFPGVNGKPLGGIKLSWASVCKAAKIDGARLHDLRHSYASVLASAGLSLPIIGSLLGHSQPGTTARYAHLLDDPLRAATERAGQIITAGNRPAAEVVDIRRRS
ncbi:tyrosine-type recombinase/integrase [Rhodopila sp.]|uniref:tyrosine-type recombinase/integrase n=1 Tax=Rhodopila sp. TaxID=2480087 RepID=UPI003D13F7BB